MKQVLLDLNNGKISVEEVPVPSLTKGVIVQNYYSLISAGTEASLLSLADKSKLGKARERPDLAKKVINKAKTDGVISAYQQAMSRLSKPEALGYSCAGVVTDSNVAEFKVGDRVACAGVGYASHAEYVSVPKNLTVKMPDNVSFEDASFTTVGAIAMQGIRNAEVTVGERVVVIGLGLVGLITVQIAKAAGCRVYGIDVDPKKIALALELGADRASNYDGLEDKVKSFSQFGADKVIITAATTSNGPIEVAGDLIRNKGRVVAVGAVGMNIPRDKYYEKEAEFVVSKSYGPGRYDRSYEENGIDYPIYIRWTEKRNMESFLELISEGKINLEKIVTHTFGVNQAVEAYDLISSRKEPFLGVLLKYDADNKSKAGYDNEDLNVVYLDESVSKIRSKSRTEGSDEELNSNISDSKIYKIPEEKSTDRFSEQNKNSSQTDFERWLDEKIKSAKPKTNTPIKKIGCIGAGIHATSALYPNLVKLPVELRGIATSTGLSAKAAAKKFGFSYCTTDYHKILEDEEIDAVVIVTRNDLHAKMAIEALKAGKHVFVEKPLATNMDDLKAVVDAWCKSEFSVMVGFNRRHSQYAIKMKDFFSNRTTPLMMNYRVNAGEIPEDHWIHDDEQGGGMLISEVCHFVDTLQFICGSKPVEVYARSPGDNGNGVDSGYSQINPFDNLQITISFEDGSTGSIIYTTLGDGAYSKEYIEVFGNHSVATLKDYRELMMIKNGKKTSVKSRLKQEKGIPEELDAFTNSKFPEFINSAIVTNVIFKVRNSIVNL